MMIPRRFGHFGAETNGRPGIAQSILMPTRLNNQVRIASPTSNLLITPVGKNSAGTTKWSISIDRPGGINTQPVIMSSKDQQALARLAKTINKK